MRAVLRDLYITLAVRRDLHISLSVCSYILDAVLADCDLTFWCDTLRHIDHGSSLARDIDPAVVVDLDLALAIRRDIDISLGVCCHVALAVAVNLDRAGRCDTAGVNIHNGRCLAGHIVPAVAADCDLSLTIRRDLYIGCGVLCDVMLSVGCQAYRALRDNTATTTACITVTVCIRVIFDQSQAQADQLMVAEKCLDVC